MEKQLEKLIYKLLVDILSLVLLVLFILMLLEGIMPGYISGYLSFTKVIFSLIALILAIVFLGRRNGIDYDPEGIKPLGKNKITVFLVIVGIILIVNSMFGLGWAEIMIVSIGTIFVLYHLLQILLFADKD